MQILNEFQQMNTYEKVKVIKFFLIILAFGLGCTQFTGVPIAFYRPPKIEDSSSSTSVSGSVSSELKFDSEYPQIQSIPMEYDLYGDNEIWEVIILTSGYGAKYIALTFLVLYPIKKRQAHYMLFTPMIIIGISLSILVFFSSPAMLVFSFFMWFGCFSLMYGQLYQYTATQFDGKLGENSVFLCNSAWSITMLFHIYYATYFGGWRENIVYFTGFSYLAIGIALVFIQKYLDRNEQIYTQLKEQKEGKISQNQQNQYNQQQNLSNSPQKKKSHTSLKRQSIEIGNHPHEVQVIHLHEQQHNKEDKDHRENVQQQQQQQQQLENEEEEEKSAFEMFKDIFNEVKENKEVRNNIIFWALSWSVCGVSYIGCVLALNRLKGNLFFNMFISTIFELIGNFFSIYLIKNFNIKSIITNNFFIMGLSYISLIFFSSGSLNNSDDNDKNGENNKLFNILISVLPVLIAKGTHETMWNLLIEFQKHILDPKYHQFNFSIGNLYDIIIDTSLPYYQYSMEKIGVNQFIGYGVYSLIIGFVSKGFKVIKSYENSENKKQMAKDGIISGKISSDIELQTLQKQLLEMV